MAHNSAQREPLFHIVKRNDISKKQSLLIRTIAVVAALVFSGILILILAKINPFDFYTAMLDGAFGSERRIWILFYRTAILLIISLAVTPAFKMKFWNCGAEGQVLVCGLASAPCMVYLGDKVSTPVLWIAMAVTSIIAGMLWAFIPAICKAQWNTNETLFTLMMNYVAIQLVLFFINTWVTSATGTLPPMERFALPTIMNDWLLNIIFVLVLTVNVYIYLNSTKHGYEISVVGESENTARYIGINVKKVIIRTMLVSGAFCGIAGLLLVGGTDYTVSANTVGGQGFTAIMVSWLAKFNPLFMMFTSFLIIFLNVGAGQVSTTFRIENSISDIITGIILFFIIGCEFFINYRIVFSKSGKGAK